MNIASRSAQDLDLAAALVSGGDLRLQIDPRTGLNQYLCAAYPSPQVVCFSSCTASPISSLGWQAARETYTRLHGDTRRPLEPEALQAEAIATAAALRSTLGLDGLAEVLLTPSGTDATLFAVGLLAAETPGRVITSIMGEALETGTGVPLAAAGRHYSDFAAGGLVFVQPGTLLQGLPQGMHTMHIPLRSADRAVRPSALVDADDIGYVQHTAEEMEVLFTFLAERHQQQRSTAVTSNLVFSQWDQIFKNPMTAMAAVDRLVHRSIILEFERKKSHREEEAEQRLQP